MQPSAPVVDSGRDQLPFAVRMIAWRSAVWSDFQTALNGCASLIVAAGYADTDVMPVNRYRQARRAFLLFQQMHPQAPVVVKYQQLCKLRLSLWGKCLVQVKAQCQLQFTQRFSGSISAGQLLYD